MVIENVDSLRDTVRPGVRVADDRRAACSGAMACVARSVVDLWSGERCGNGLRLNCGFNIWRCCLVLFTWQVNLTNRANALGNRGFKLGRVPGVNALSKIGHFHGNHEERDQDNGYRTENKGIHVKKFLVAAQRTTPNAIFVLTGAQPRPVAGDYITRSVPMQSPYK